MTSKKLRNLRLTNREEKLVAELDRRYNSWRGDLYAVVAVVLLFSLLAMEKGLI